MKRIAVLASRPLAAAASPVGAARAGLPRPSRRPTRRAPAFTSCTVPERPNRRCCLRRSRRPPAQPAVRSYDAAARALAVGRAPPTASPGTCSPPSTRSSRTSARTWARARRARVGWMQFMPVIWLRWGMDATATESPIPGTPTTPCLPRRATSPPPARTRTSRARSLPTTTRSGTSTTSSASPASSEVGSSPSASSPSPAGAERRAVRGRRPRAADCESSPGGRARAQAIPSPSGSSTARAARGSRSSGAPAIPTLSDAKFADLERRIARLASASRSAHAAIVHAARPSLARPSHELGREVELSARRPSAAPTTAAARRRPESTGDYVFPVGGGPSLVSVAHDHHDYPAADIAAPEGSPLYALADSRRQRVLSRRRAASAASASSSASRTARSTSTATLPTSSRASCREPPSPPARPSGSSARPATRPGRTSILQFARRLPTRRRAVVRSPSPGGAFSWQDAPTPPRTGRGRTGSGQVFTIAPRGRALVVA